jgi:hypothetical protein
MQKDLIALHICIQPDYQKPTDDKIETTIQHVQYSFCTLALSWPSKFRTTYLVLKLSESVVRTIATY